MIIEYNVKYNKNIKKTDLQSNICEMFANEQRQVDEIVDVHSELIKLSSIIRYTLFQNNIDQTTSSRSFKNK
ncbi:MAG TPA: hypothetical protein VKA98_09860 [Nitrososphaeraceae archaeon]|nr:hypothetical protein [Nitrososphaeraceae archaeon]